MIVGRRGKSASVHEVRTTPTVRELSLRFTDAFQSARRANHSLSDYSRSMPHYCVTGANGFIAAHSKS